MYHLVVEFQARVVSCVKMLEHNRSHPFFAGPLDDYGLYFGRAIAGGEGRGARKDGLLTSALPPKADILGIVAKGLLLSQSGHHRFWEKSSQSFQATFRDSGQMASGFSELP